MVYKGLQKKGKGTCRGVKRSFREISVSGKNDHEIPPPQKRTRMSIPTADPSLLIQVQEIKVCMMKVFHREHRYLSCDHGKGPQESPTLYDEGKSDADHVNLLKTSQELCRGVKRPYSEISVSREGVPEASCPPKKQRMSIPAEDPSLLIQVQEIKVCMIKVYDQEYPYLSCADVKGPQKPPTLYDEGKSNVDHVSLLETSKEPCRGVKRPYSDISMRGEHVLEIPCPSKKKKISIPAEDPSLLDQDRSLNVGPNSKSVREIPSPEKEDGEMEIKAHINHLKRRQRAWRVHLLCRKIVKKYQCVRLQSIRWRRHSVGVLDEGNWGSCSRSQLTHGRQYITGKPHTVNSDFPVFPTTIGRSLDCGRKLDSKSLPEIFSSSEGERRITKTVDHRVHLTCGKILKKYQRIRRRRHGARVLDVGKWGTVAGLSLRGAKGVGNLADRSPLYHRANIQRPTAVPNHTYDQFRVSV